MLPQFLVTILTLPDAVTANDCNLEVELLHCRVIITITIQIADLVAPNIHFE